jgi:hypothetical protein
MTKQIVAFRNFVKAPRNVEIYNPASIGSQEKYYIPLTPAWGRTVKF